MVIVISFEGMPKSGKTSLASVVYEYYKIKGYAVLLYKDTYLSEHGVLALKYAEKREKRPFSTSFLFASALMKAYEDILSLLGSYDLVVVDNFYSYYLLYTAIKDVNVPSVEDFLLKLTIPNIVFYLNVDYKTVKERSRVSKITHFSEILNSEEVFETTKKKFRSKLAKRFPYKVVDIDASKGEVFELLKQVKSVINVALKGSIS
jgi:thymidylate kinase